jgi:Flp pilus assembly protein TadG
MKKIFKNLIKQTDGATAVEFAIISIPLFTMVFGGMEISYEQYVVSQLQGAMTEATRMATVETTSLGGTGTTAQKIQSVLQEKVRQVAPQATVTVQAKSYSNYSGIGKPEKIITDVKMNGKYDALDGDCFEDSNFNGSYDVDRGSSGTGSGNDVVVYQANLQMKRVFPVHYIAGLGEDFTVTRETIFRNQPYANQKTPPTLCGK